MDFTALFICLMVFMVIQALGTYVQVQQYKKAVRRLHKRGNIGIGSKRSKLKNNIVIIACNNEGTIGNNALCCRSGREYETLARVLDACPYGEVLRYSKHHKIEA